jgi:hypothetical protein
LPMSKMNGSHPNSGSLSGTADTPLRKWLLIAN